jgi:hypothetical protein
MLKTISIFILVFFVVVFAAISTALIHPNLLRGAISSGAERFAGLELNIGELHSHLNPLRFELKQVSIRNPDWGDEKLLQLDDLKLQLTELPFAAEPFWDLYGNGITIVVARNEKGELNWISSKLASGETTPPEQTTAPPGSLLPSDFNFNDIKLENVSFTWRNGELEETVVLPLVSAQRVEAGNGKLRLNVEYREERFEIESKVDLFDPKNGILNYQLGLQHQDAQLKTKGRLVLSPDLKGSEIDVDLAVQDLSRLAALAEAEAPVLPPTTVTATLAFTPDYEIRDLALKSGDSEINGNVTVSQGDFAVTADLTAPFVDIDQLFPASTEEESEDEESTEEGPIDWQWLDNINLALKAKINTLNARGWAVSNLGIDTNIKEKITADISAAEINEAQTQRQFNDVAISANLDPLSTTTQGADLSSKLKLRLGDIQLNANGPLNVNGLKGTELTVKGSAPQTAAIWQLAQLPWKEAGPLAIEATLASDGERHSAKGSANMGQQKTEFDLRYLDQARPRLDGELELSKLDLAFINEAKPLAEAGDEPKANTSKKGPLFSQEPIALDALKGIDAKLVITLNDIDTGYNLLKRAKLNPQLDNGKFTLQTSTLQFDHGEASIAAELDSNGNEPSLKTTFKLSSDDFGQLGLDKAAGIRGGNGRIELEADSRGQSPAELAANLNADINAKITDLEAKGNALNLIGSDLLTEMISKLNPFAKKRTTTDIECVAVHFSGKNGKLVSNNGIALETDATKIVGTGNIDLADESLSFGVSPIARKGVGINIGAAAGLVRLAGSLQNPRIVADASGMVSSGLSTGAAIYTGGLSLLAQGLYKRAMYAGSSCDGSLEEVPEVEELPDELINPPAPQPGNAPSASGLTQPNNAEAVTPQ